MANDKNNDLNNLPNFNYDEEEENNFMKKSQTVPVIQY